MTLRIIIVEDDRLTRQTLAAFLRREGHDVREAVGVSACRAALLDAPADLILLDLGLPGEDAVAFAQELRALKAAAVFVVTQDERIDTRLQLLEEGADDFVTKPVHFRELGARITNLGRRLGKGDVHRLGDWIVDLSRRQVATQGGEVARLTRGELDLLAGLLKAGGEVLSREALSAILRGAPDGDLRSVDALISRIRRKLGSSGDLILTVPGVGYALKGMNEAAGAVDETG